VVPREPGARHIEYDVVEVRLNEIEELRHHIGIERTHLRRPVRRGNDCKAGGMMRQHDFKQLAIEPVRPRLDLAEIEAGFEIEIVGASPVLEVQIVESGSRFAAFTDVEQDHRAMDRERGYGVVATSCETSIKTG